MASRLYLPKFVGRAKMGSLGSHNDGTKKPYKGESDVEIGDTQHLEFDSQYSPFSGVETEDLLNGLLYPENPQPFGDTLLANDAFETQPLDFDTETQALDFETGTQPLDLAEETQVMDLGEETQVLDNEGDCYNNLETQPLDFDTNEEETVAASDDDDTVGTEVLTDTYISGQEEVEFKSVGSVHSAAAACSSGPSGCSVRRGFASIRTASLRASGISARKKSIKDVKSGDASDQNGAKPSSRLCDEAVDSDVGKTNVCVEGLSCDSNTKRGRFTARKLLLDDFSIDEPEHDDITDDGARGEDLGQVHSCANDLAGLSYVNSQEPGDLSQANALDFVDQFLKDSVSDFDLDARRTHVACENQNPVVSAKGTQKLAKKANRRCSLAKTGVYDWDNSLEDEGGGEFLTRNKELFFGKKPLTEPPKAKNLSHMKRGRQQKSINEEGLNKHITVLGLRHSEPISAAGRKVDQVEKLNIRRDLSRDFEKQVCTDSTVMQVETEAIDAEMLETVGVGVNTQMAAEAMETLSKGVRLSMDDENASEGEDCRGQLKDKMTKSRTVKQNSIGKRVHGSESDLGVTTRSKRRKKSSNQVGDESKRSVASHPQIARTEVVKEATNRIQNAVKITDLNVEGVLDKRALKVKDKVKKGAQERNVDDNGSAPKKKRSVEKKINSVAPVASRTRKNRPAPVHSFNTALESSDAPKTTETRGTDGSKRKRNNVGVGAKEKSPKLTAQRDGFHSTELNRRSSRNVQNRSDKDSENGKSNGSFEESAKHDLGGESITKKRRSNRSMPPQKQSKPISCSNEHDVCGSPSAKNTQPEHATQGTPKEMAKSSLSACTTPVNLRTPINTASPVCMGDKYYNLSCNKNRTRSALMKELNSLTSSASNLSSPDKGLRKRRDMASIKVLFSHHLDEDIIRHQKKILARLGATAVSSLSDATHFVADEFLRTRNMLEAIAHGKPVVNHLWLESCGHAGCCIDEKKYLLRDAKKEKELGFSMPDSLARACQHPLLEGRRVLITPNTLPGVEILSSLVKAVHGQAFERICRSIYKGDKIRSNLLVLSCEEDYEFCLPLLKKGAEVFSSELILNGIVIQKLEFERHRLFSDQVKRTRSTIWLKEGGHEFHRV